MPRKRRPLERLADEPRLRPGESYDAHPDRQRPVTGPSPAERAAARLEQRRLERESRATSKPTYIVEDEDPGRD